MGMPATIYRYFYRAHSLKSLERNILGFIGIAPIRETLVGMTGKLDEAGAQRWFRKLEKLGQNAQ
jgi:putative NADPH-quinone reductase